MMWGNISTKMTNRIIAVIMAFSMVFTMGFATPIAYAEGGSVSAITGIAPLDDDVAVQHLQVGATEEDIYFPSSVNVTLETTNEVLVEVIDEVIEQPETVLPEEAVVEELIEELADETTEDEITDEVAEGTDVDDVQESEGEELAEEIATTPETPAETTDNTEVAPAQSETPAAVESAPVEAAPAPVESAPAAPAESAPVESAPAESAPAEAPADPVAFIIDTLFPAMVVHAADAGVFEEVSNMTAEALGNASEETAVEETPEVVSVPAEPRYVVETVTTTETITLSGVTWTLDADRSYGPEFDSSVAGASYVYVASIPTDYPMNAAMPTITIIIDEEETEVAAFQQSVVVDGVVITVKADEGVFPVDATVSARTATADEKEVFDSAVENLEDLVPVVDSYVFDIKVLDAAGNEIQPDTSKGQVYVSFESPEIANNGLEASIYHIPDSENGNTEAEKLDTDTVGDALEAETESFSLYGVAITEVGPNVFDNDEYPYMVSQDSEGVKLAVRLNGDATSIKWYKSTETNHTANVDEISDEAWTEIGSGETTITLSGDALTSGAWYGCVVNGNKSKPVQLIGGFICNWYRETDVLGRQWTRPMMPWYVSNGVMAYGVKGEIFDVTGYYRQANLMIETSYGNGWQMKSINETSPEMGYGSTAQLDNLYVRFGGDDGYAVFFEADLAEGQKSFSFGCDTQLADYDLIGKYADGAALFAEKDGNGMLDYVAMVGAASKNASDDTPAFLIKPITKEGLRFWIGYYGSSYSGHYDYNKNDLNGCETGSIKQSDGTVENNVALSVTDTDSGMTMSWRNVDVVRFQFSVGDVASTVAKVGGNIDYKNEQIKGLEKNTRYIIKENNQEICRITTDENGNLPLSDGTYGEDGFYDLTGKTIVIEKESPAEGDIPSDPMSIVSRSVTPEFDTSGTDNGGDADKPADVGKDVIKTTNKTITVNSETENCQYRLYDANGNEIPGQDWVTLANGTYVFDDLDEGAEYTIKSRVKPTSSKPGSLPSAGVKVTTKSTVDVTAPTVSTTTNYDGNPVSYPVVSATTGAKVEYSINPNTNYTETLPTFTNAGIYTVYYKVSKDGCTPVYGSYQVVINKQRRDAVDVQDSISIPAEGTDAGTIDISSYLGAGSQLLEYVVDGDMASYVTDVSVDNGELTYKVVNSPAGTTGTLKVKVYGTNDQPYWIIIPLESKAKPAPVSVASNTTEATPAPTPVPAKPVIKPVVEEVIPEIVVEPVVETVTNPEPEKTPVVEQLLDIAEEVLEDAIGKGNIVDNDDIWKDMTDDTKLKLLEKLEEKGGEVVRSADMSTLVDASLAELKAEQAENKTKEDEDKDKVPVSEKPVALVMGEGAVVVSLELADNSKANAGLADAKAVAKSILTEEQYAAVAAGSILEIKVEVTPLDDTVIPELDRQVIDDGVAAYTEQLPNLSMADYIDISMFMRIDDNDWNQLTEVDPIDIVIDIPENHKGKSDKYYIMRAHEGVSTLLEDLDGNDDTVTISTGQFSTYALMYDEPQVATKADFVNTVAVEKCHVCHMCPTFLGTCYFVWLIMISVVGISLELYKKVKKQREEE